MQAIAAAFSGPARVITLVGAGIGLLGYLVSGLIPAIVYGSFAGMSVAQTLVGEVGADTLRTGLEVGGAVITSVAAGAAFIAVGAVVGAALNVLVRVMAR